MANQLIELLNEYKNKLLVYYSLKENLATKFNSIKKNLKIIQKEFQDELSVISDFSINTGTEYFSLPKVEDENIGFCGTLEFNIFQHQLTIDRIGFDHQVDISFYKDEIRILDENYTSDKAYKHLDTKQFINVYKTISYFLSHKDKIRKLIDDYLFSCLENSNKIISENIAFISSIL